jgi:hypothetical protein
MHGERELEAGAGEPRVARPRVPEEELDELLFTLEICRRALPWDAHPEHYDRLRRSEGMVARSLERR